MTTTFGLKPLDEEVAAKSFAIFKIQSNFVNNDQACRSDWRLRQQRPSLTTHLLPI